MKVYALLPSVYSPFSNGIITLIRFYREFQRRVDAEFRFLVCTKNAQTLKTYRGMFGARLLAYSPDSTVALAKAIASEKFSLIRPDDLEGISNPVHWHLASEPSLQCRLNILLAPPFVFAKSRSILEYYGPKDHFVIANQTIMPSFVGHENRDCYLESEVDLRPLDSRGSTLSPSKKISVYIGKGIAAPVDGLESFLDSLKINPNSCGMAYINRSCPKTKSDLHEVLLSSAFLLSFDPFSHIEREASLLGVPLLKPASLNLSELPGVFTSLQELMAIDLHASRSRLATRAWRDYNQKRSANQSSILKASSALPELLIANHCPEDSRISIRYSEHLLYAFGSQLRAYQPLVGQVHLCSIVDKMSSQDVVQVLSNVCRSANAIEYNRMVSNYLSAIGFGARGSGNQDRHKKPVIFRYSG